MAPSLGSSASRTPRAAAFLLDDHGTIVAVNGAMARMLDAPPSALEGRSLGALEALRVSFPIPPDLRQAPAMWVGAATVGPAEGQQGVDLVFHVADEERGWFSCELRPRAARMPVADRAAWFDALMSSGSDAVLVCSAGRILHASPTCAHTIGIPPAALAGRSLGPLLDEAGRVQLLRAMTAPSSAPVAVVIRRPDGGRLPREATVRAVPALGKEAHLVVLRPPPAPGAPAAEEPPWAAVLGCAPLIVAVLDAEGRIVYTNQAEGGVGAHLDDFVWPEDRANARAAWGRVMLDGRAELSEFRVRKPDGSVGWFDAHAVPWDTGRGRQVLVLATDVTRRKLSEERIQETVRAMETAEQDNLVTLHMVAHELRAPLTAMKLQAELAAQAIRPMDFGILDRGLRRMETLVDDLTDFVRLKERGFVLNREIADLARIVQDATDALESTARLHDRRFALTLAPALVDVDRQRIDQALTNLLGNALKYSEPGQAVRVAMTVAAGAVRVDVIDEGRGMRPEDLPKLFHQFVRLEGGGPWVAGTGLGLCIAHLIVTQHGGKLSAVSPGLGQGSTFTIELPLATTTGPGGATGPGGPPVPP